MSSAALERIKKLGLNQLEGLPWADEIRQGRFSEALSLVENELSRTPDCPGTKLWWVRCQLELERLPAAALTSPLEEIADKLNELPELHLLACGSFLSLALVLQEKNQARLALAMLERGKNFAVSAGLADEDLRQLTQLLVDLLQEELKRAQLRRESKKYVASLEDKLEAEKRNLSGKKKAPEKQERPAKLSAKSVLVAGMSDAVHAAKDDWQVGGEGAVEEQKDPLSGSKENPSPQEPRRVLTSLTLLAALCIIGLLGWRYFSQASAAALESRLAMNLSLLEGNNLEMPVLRQITAKAARTSLDAVGKRLELLTVKKENKDEVKPGPAPSAAGEIDREALNPAHAAKLPKPAKGEEEELESLGGPDSTRNDIKLNKVPYLDPEKLAKTKVEDIGSSPRKAPVPESIRNGGEAPGGERALNGSPLQAYEVNKFDPPLRYRTLTATEVLSAPSLLAASLARLDQNTPVDVTARMGQWLELRSTAGRIGYIYAQDAVEEKKR